MNIIGKKITVNKSANEVFDILSTPTRFEEIMPENTSKFEASDTGFVFALSGMPEVGVTLASTEENQKVVYKSAKESLDFELRGELHPIDDQSTEVQLFFDGKFNPFIKMMVEKPLTNFLEAVTSKIESIG